MWAGTVDDASRMPVCSFHVELARPVGATTACVCMEVVLEPGAFTFDRRLAAGLEGGEWIDSDEYESALAGERPVGCRDAQKALRRLLQGMAAEPEASGLRFGPDSCEATMNNYAGIRRQDVQDVQATMNNYAGIRRQDVQDVQAGGGVAAAAAAAAGGGGGGGGSAAEFDLGRLLESISTSGDLDSISTSGDGRVLAERLGGLREECGLYPFQQNGIAWMADKEEEPDRLSLHPAWVQLRAPNGRLFYLHSWTGELTLSFFTAPRLETCGGMLCDDVGLGKSLQLLGLILARPPPAEWPLRELPTHTEDVLPIKATLIVAPAALLSQWESEVRAHVHAHVHAHALCACACACRAALPVGVGGVCTCTDTGACTFAWARACPMRMPHVHCACACTRVHEHLHGHAAWTYAACACARARACARACTRACTCVCAGRPGALISHVSSPRSAPAPRQVRKHTKPGALKVSTYLGIGGARKKAAAAAVGKASQQGGVSADGEEAVAPQARRRPSRRSQSSRAEGGEEAGGGGSGGGGGGGGDGAGGAAGSRTLLHEVLAKTQRQLFEPPVNVEECDLVLCSFETL